MQQVTSLRLTHSRSQIAGANNIRAMLLLLLFFCMVEMFSWKLLFTFIELSEIPVFIIPVFIYTHTVTDRMKRFRMYTIIIICDAH